VDKNRAFGSVLTEKTGSAATTYTYGLGLIQQTPSGGSPHFYHQDGQLSTRQLTTTSGTVSDTFTYDSYGVKLSATGSTPNDYQYTGEQYDPSLGLYYLRARYMSPSNGRFWSMDSYAGQSTNPLSLHRYLYASANPVLRVDPSGHDDLTLKNLMIAQAITGTLITLARPGLGLLMSVLHGGLPDALSAGWFGGRGFESNRKSKKPGINPMSHSEGADVIVGAELTIAPRLKQVYFDVFGGLEMVRNQHPLGSPENLKADILRDALGGDFGEFESGWFEAYHWDYKGELGLHFENLAFAGVSEGGMWGGVGEHEVIFGTTSNNHASVLALGAIPSYAISLGQNLSLRTLQVAAGVADAFFNDRWIMRVPLVGDKPLDPKIRLALDLLSGGCAVTWVTYMYK